MLANIVCLSSHTYRGKELFLGVHLIGTCSQDLERFCCEAIEYFLVISLVTFLVSFLVTLVSFLVTWGNDIAKRVIDRDKNISPLGGIYGEIPLFKHHPIHLSRHLRHNEGLWEAHQVESEEAFAEILEAGTKMIDIVINDEESVVEVGTIAENFYMARCAIFLFVVSLQSEDVGANLLGVDSSTNIGFSRLQNMEGICSHICINEDNFVLCTFDKGLCDLSTFKEMALKDDTLVRGLVGANEERYLFFMLLKAIFNTNEPVINMLLECDKLVVDAVATEEVLLKDAICPRPEEDALRRVYAITNGKDHVEGVVLCLIYLAIGGSCRKFCDNWIISSKCRIF